MKTLIALTFIALGGALVANETLGCEDETGARMTKTLNYDVNCRDDSQRKVIPGRL